MIGIRNRLSASAAALAVLLLCSCVSSYVPDQSAAGSVPTFTVEQARAEILGGAVRSVYFFDRRDASIALNSPAYMVAKISVSNTTLTVVTGYKTYNVPLTDINPSVFRDDSDGNEYVDVYLSNVQGFYANYVAEGNNLYQWTDSKPPQRLADALLVLKKAAIQFKQDDEARFQAAAQKYRVAASKPQLPEAAHRFEVQAEGAIRDKDFYAAAELYEQAIEVAPWWPEFYFNRALALSEFNDFPDAITEMSRYLILAPDASDARAAQDKIYDWQRQASIAS